MTDASPPFSQAVLPPEDQVVSVEAKGISTVNAPKIAESTGPPPNPRRPKSSTLKKKTMRTSLWMKRSKNAGPFSTPKAWSCFPSAWDPSRFLRWQAKASFEKSSEPYSLWQA